MWPFKRKSLLDPEIMEWMFGQAEWLLTAHSHRATFAQAQLLPLSERVFPINGIAGHALAERLFQQVKVFAGMAGLPITLTPLGTSGRFSGATGVQPRSDAAGTYRHGERGREISYDAGLLKVPADFIAVMAHETAHAILDLGAQRAPPGDPEFEEMRTDFTAVFCGFGLYLTQFRADRRVMTPEIAHEWKKLFMYYMTLPELCFATALFCRVRGIDKKIVLRAAPDLAYSKLKHAFADLDRHQDWLEALQAMAKAAAPTTPKLRVIK
jgi:hypothetical protein